MTHPTNTVLNQEDIRRIALEAGCDPERDDGALVSRLIALAERAVIERLGASDVAPVAWEMVAVDADGTVYRRGLSPKKTNDRDALHSWGEGVVNWCKIEHRPLCYVTALAQATERGRQQGLQQGREEARPDTERLNWLDAANLPMRMGWDVGIAPAGNCVVMSIIQIRGEPKPIRAAIDAARQPTQGPPDAKA